MQQGETKQAADLALQIWLAGLHVLVELTPFAPMFAAEKQAFVKAAQKYGRVLGVDVVFS
jgi:hypothetical protein